MIIILQINSNIQEINHRIHQNSIQMILIDMIKIEILNKDHYKLRALAQIPMDRRIQINSKIQ